MTTLNKIAELAVSFLFPPKQKSDADEWQLLPPLHINEAGWLEGENVEIIATDPSWYYPKLSTPHGDPLAVVAHASDTPLGTARVMANNRHRPRTPADRQASWHASVEDGYIVQMAPFHVGCWHAIHAIKGVGPANRTAVGIEFVGKEQGPFPRGQIAQGARLWRALVTSYGIKREFAMVPHSIIDPADRTDPGKLFMTQHAPAILEFAYAK